MVVRSRRLMGKLALVLVIALTGCATPSARDATALDDARPTTGPSGLLEIDIFALGLE